MKAALAVAYIMGEKAFEDAYLFVLGIKQIFGYGGRVILKHLEGLADEIIGSGPARKDR